MSTLLEQASLVMIPSGYKEDVVYSQIPTSGAGDLSFTRASNGTRINSSGLVEVCPWNLVSQSVWPSIGTGVAPTSWIVGTGPATNFSAGPLAGQLLCNTSANRGFIQQTLSFTAGEYALSVFVDSVTTAGPIAQMISIFGSTGVKYYEDEIEVTSSTSIVAVKRYTVVGTVTTGSFTLRIGSGITGNTTANYVISRPQLNIGSTAKPYFPTTDRLNVPRLTYQNGGGGCPSLLLEPQRTNLALYSEQFDNAAWTKTASSVTANSTTSPSGVVDADTLTADGTSSRHDTFFAPSVTSGTNYTYSVYAKKGTNDFLQLSTGGGFGSNAFANFDLNTGIIGTIGSAATATITALGNGWYRCTMTAPATITGGTGIYNLIVTSSTASRLESNTLTTSVFLWGAQFEAGAYPTTYIPTTSATATRVADSFSRNNIYTNGLISASGGTWFVELRNNEAYTRDASTVGLFLGSDSAGTTNSFVLRAASGSSRMSIAKYVGGAFTQIYLTTTTTAKIAIKWNGSTADVFVNGTKEVSATAFTATALEFLAHATTGDVPKFIQQMALFNSPLTDTQCQTLTT